MKNPSKRQPKLTLSTLSIRPLVKHLELVAGGQRPENWTGTTGKCTHDIFCPTASGMCA